MARARSERRPAEGHDDTPVARRHAARTAASHFAAYREKVISYIGLDESGAPPLLFQVIISVSTSQMVWSNGIISFAAITRLAKNTARERNVLSQSRALSFISRHYRPLLRPR